MEADIESPKTRGVSLPLVSVIIVNFNYGKYLRQCLASVVQQDYGEIECILVDNASTDASRAVFAGVYAELPDRWKGRLSLVALETNQHQTLASIAGFQRSRGHFVLFLDADDFLLSHCVRCHVQAHLSARDCVGLSCGDMVLLTEDQLTQSSAAGVARFVQSGRGRKPGAFRLLTERAGVGIELLRDIAALHEALHFVEPRETIAWPWSATSAFCYRREAVGLMFNYVPRITGSTDAYLAHGIAALTGGILIDLPLAAYRRHGSNIFSARPALRGFYPFDVEKESAVLCAIAKEILEAYLFGLRDMAAALQDKGTFLLAVDHISKLIDDVSPRRGASRPYYLEFVAQHRRELVDRLGSAVVDASIEAGARAPSRRLRAFRWSALASRARTRSGR